MIVIKASWKDLIKIYRFLKMAGKAFPDPYFIITDRKIDHIKTLARLIKHTFLNSFQGIVNYSTMIWLAEGYDGVVGVAIVGIRNGKAILHSIFVSKSYRKRGIGSKLMEAVLDFCRRKQLYSLALAVARDNIPAINLYKKYGFKVISCANGNICMELHVFT